MMERCGGIRRVQRVWEMMEGLPDRRDIPQNHADRTLVILRVLRALSQLTEENNAKKC